MRAYRAVVDGSLRALDQADDLQLPGCGIPHSGSSLAIVLGPMADKGSPAIMLFLSRRFSRVRSATASFSALISWRRSFTSPEDASRAVSPARRRFPAYRNSYDQL